MAKNFYQQITEIKSRKIDEDQFGLRLLDAALSNYVNLEKKGFYEKAPKLFEINEANSIYRSLNSLIENPSLELTQEKIMSDYGKVFSKAGPIYSMQSIVDGIFFLTWRKVQPVEISNLLAKSFLEKQLEFNNEREIPPAAEYWEYVAGFKEKIKLEYHARL